MLNIQLARKYGVAIFEIAKEDNKLEEYGKELAQVSKDLFSHADLKGFLTNPQVQPQAKKDILSKLVQGEISDLMFKFLLLLVDKRRIVLLEAINECYQELSNKEQGIVIADVTSAFELKDELRQSLGRKLEEVTGKKVQLTHYPFFQLCFKLSKIHTITFYHHTLFVYQHANFLHQ